jgi:hypothetical protein
VGLSPALIFFIAEGEIARFSSLGAIVESQQLRVILPKQRAKDFRIAIDHCVDLLNHPKGIRGHNQQVAETAGAGIPVSMWCAAWHHYSGPGVSFNFAVADLNAQRAFQDIPDFIIPVVEVQGSDESSLIDWTTRILPLSNHETLSGRTNCISL